MEDKKWMLKNQRDAKMLMTASGDIWKQYGWKHGGMVNMNILKQKLKAKIGKKKFSPVVAEILEDANFHSEERALEEMGVLKYKGNKLNRYRKLGGKTWEL